MTDTITFQSSTPATPPSATVIATDDAGVAGQVQIVKLAISTDGSATPLTADNTDGLLVNLGSNNDITGTVTANLGATDNAVLDAIQAAVETIDNAISGTEMQVDVLTLPNVTNGGTFAVQEDGAALTALQLIDDVVFAEDVAAQAADKGIAILAVRRDADTSLVGADNDYANLQVNASGALKVEIFDGGDSHTIDGTVTANLGATDNAVLDAIQAAVETIDDAISGTEMQVDVLTLPSIPAGINNIGDVDIASIAAGDNNIGNVDIASIAAGDNNIGNVDLASAIPTGSNLIGQVNPQPTTSGGLLIFRSLDLDETEEEVKGSAGQVYGWFITNRRTSAIYVKFYNATAANVTVGTTTPVITLAIPGNSTDYIAANALGAMGIAFDTAITVAATTGLADNDTGAPSANECVVNIFYK